MASVEQIAEALVQLGYENFYTLKAALNKGDCLGETISYHL